MNSHEESEQPSLDQDSPIRKFESKRIKRYTIEGNSGRSTTQTKTSEGRPSDPDLRFSMKKAPKLLSPFPDSELQKRGVIHLDLSHEENLPKGVMNLSVANKGQDVGHSDSGA